MPRNRDESTQAHDYEYRICDKVAAGRGYADFIGDAKADFNTRQIRQTSQAPYLRHQPALASSGIELINQWYNYAGLPCDHVQLRLLVDPGVAGKHPRPYGRGGRVRLAGVTHLPVPVRRHS